MQNPIHFGAGDEALLKAAGYTHTFWPARWHDIGSTESGPKLHGYPDSHVWTLSCNFSEHEIVVCGGVVVSAEYVPIGPSGSEY